jgi:hypothetical protein
VTRPTGRNERPAALRKLTLSSDRLQIAGGVVPAAGVGAHGSSSTVLRASLRRSIAVPQFARTYAVPGVLPYECVALRADRVAACTSWRRLEFRSRRRWRPTMSWSSWSRPRSRGYPGRCSCICRRATTRPARHPGARPPDGGRTDSASTSRHAQGARRRWSWSSTCRRRVARRAPKPESVRTAPSRALAARRVDRR